jgi:UDP-N-acetylmuramoyl-tripeptide--D-alanyl-D-alanine ligase
VARAKGEVVAALPASGLAVLSFDDPRVRDMASLSACPVLGYAVGADAEVRADDITLDRDLRARFRLSSAWGQTEVRLGLHGVHQVAGRGGVRSLAALPGERKLAVLGLMAELGDWSESEHRRIALVAEGLGIEVVGYEAALHGEAHVTGVWEAVALLRTMGPDDAALVKGSRVARLEDVVRAYGEAEGAPPCQR